MGFKARGRKKEPATKAAAPQASPLPEQLEQLGQRLRAHRRSGPVLRTARREFEAYVIAEVLRQVGGDKRAAARRLNVSYSSLKAKAREYKL